MANDEKVYRMLRVLEYVGTIDFINQQLDNRAVKERSPISYNSYAPVQGVIREAFLGYAPELVNQARDLEAYRQDLIPADYEQARNKLSSFFMDYPLDEDDQKMNEEIAKKPLVELVEIMIKMINDMKQRPDVEIEVAE